MPGFVPPVDASSAGDDGGALSGVAGIFSAIGTSITQVYSAVNPQRPVISAPPGSLILNPQTGQYGPPPSALTTTLGGNTGILIFLGIGLIAIILLKR